MNFIIGLLGMGVGFLFVLKSEWLLSNFGRIGFFEEKFGTEGGSRLGYKLLGIVIIFFGFLVFTGMIGSFLEWILGPLLKYSRQMNDI